MPMIGLMRERLVIQQNDPPTISISSLTRTSTTATASCATPHGYATGDYVTIAGATSTGYNGKVKVTVVDDLTFTYPVSGALATPATGTLTAVYVSDAQGGRRVGWTTLASISAELVPIRATERLQFQAIQSDVVLRFRVRARHDFSPKQRALWTPTAPAGSARRTLEVTGVLPYEDGRFYQYLECAEAAA